MTDRIRHDPSPARRLGFVERLTEHLRYMRDVRQHDLDDTAETARIVAKFLNTEAHPTHSTGPRCTICSSPLDMPGRPWTRDCGGDCVVCMGECGDPDAEACLAVYGAGWCDMATAPKDGTEILVFVEGWPSEVIAAVWRDHPGAGGWKLAALSSIAFPDDCVPDAWRPMPAGPYLLRDALLAEKE